MTPSRCSGHSKSSIKAMINIVFDTNLLEAPAAEEFLSMSRDHAILISDWTYSELTKKEPVRTCRASLAIAAQHPSQVYVLAETHLILELDIRSKEDAIGLIDFEESARISTLAQELQVLPTSRALNRRMAREQARALSKMRLIRSQVEHWQQDLSEAIKVFTPEERRAIRRSQNIGESTKKKMFQLLLVSTRNFILDNHERKPEGNLSLHDAVGLFGFRYSLCVLLYTIDWMQKGEHPRNTDKRVNDVIDLQITAIGTYFEGTFTNDQKARRLIGAARAILRNWNAYVGEDWQHPDLIGEN